MAMLKIPKKKRKPGVRAGMTREKIARTAAKLLEADGLDAFSVRKLAKSLGVAPTTVFAHFKSGPFALHDEIARVSLSGVAPPFKPNESAADYLAALFFRFLETLHGQPTLSLLVVVRLTANPALDPYLAERILASLAALGVQPGQMAFAFRRAVEALSTMIIAGPNRSHPATQHNRAKAIEATISALPSDEFPTLTALQAALCDEAAAGATQAPTPAVAKAYVDRLIHDLGSA